MYAFIRFVRAMGQYGWILMGGLAVGGAVFLVRDLFPAANPDLVAAVAAFVIAGLFVIILKM